MDLDMHAESESEGEGEGEEGRTQENASQRQTRNLNTSFFVSRDPAAISRRDIHALTREVLEEY
jgi:hypothetical protein